MGTNFYLFTKSKQKAQKLAPNTYTLVDEPSFGYRIHIAKTSMGWLPLFQAHDCGIQSVKEYLNAIKDGCQVFDEYGSEYNLEEFINRVLKFNGGVVGGEIPYDIMGERYDSSIPAQGPISHIAGTSQSYHYQYYPHHQYNYFTDADGYEFDWSEFS